ncbi:MAG: hypothetical protein J2P17_27775, partial [Mycobacterium sp.]|nr:hypothetical protein [Mycobacterium sp.]
MTVVHGVVMTRTGTNRVIAHDLFADYLTHENVMSALSEGIVAPVAVRQVTTKDKPLQQFFRLCAAGVPMPSFAQMDAV